MGQVLGRMWTLAAQHLDEIAQYPDLQDDLEAMRRLWYRGYIPDSQARRMEERLIKRLMAQKGQGGGWQRWLTGT